MDPVPMTRNLWRWAPACVLPAALWVSIPALAQWQDQPSMVEMAPEPVLVRPPAEIDITSLDRELSWISPDPRDLSMIRLLPPVLMRALLVQGGDVTPEQVEEAVGVFDPYLPVGVIRGHYAEEGEPVFESARALYSSVRAIDDRGHLYYPELSPDSLAVQAMVAMHHVLAAGLGELGAHMTYLLFPARSVDGQELFPLDRRARFHIELTALGELGPQRVTWRLPLAALLQDRICPLCGEGFNGAWNNCPWDGTPLVSAEEYEWRQHHPRPRAN